MIQQIDLPKIIAFIKKYLNYILGFIILLLLFIKCDGQTVNTSVVLEKEKTIKSLLNEVKEKESIVIQLNKKVSESDKRINKLLSELPKKVKATKKKIKQVDDFDINEHYKFFSQIADKKDLSKFHDKLAFNKKALDTVAKTIICGEWANEQKEIYREAYFEASNQSKIKDTIMNVYKDIYKDMDSALVESEYINKELKQQLKKKNKPKIGKYLIAVGVGFLGGVLLAN